ncbi:P-II family nitrogen regulator [Pseudomonas aeruginosa]|nr:P-II family nitrogen regulator [Pseudomonas aeruginosa]
MKLITAVIKPSLLDDVRQALTEAGVSGVTATTSRVMDGSGAFGDLPMRGVRR